MSGVTDLLAHNLLDLARGHGDVDKKINEFAAIKAQIKHWAVQTEAISPLFEACRIAVISPNSSLAAQALSCLGHLCKRISIQEPSRLRAQAHNTLPPLVEKLGDAKERNKTTAASAIIEIYKHAPQEVEKIIKDTGLISKNPRIRQESVRWIAQTHATFPSFSFKSYTPHLIGMLEDPSEPVRDTAKNVVVELFSNAPDHAKSDLKRELAKRGVRKAIANFIISQLGLPGASEVMSQDGHEEEASNGRLGVKVPSVSGSMASSTYVMSLPGFELEDMAPVHVNTNRELEDIFDAMVGPFEGRESEHNWMAREANVNKIRALLRGNAYSDYQMTFLTRVKSLLDGILKALNSLRTSLSTTGGQCIKDLAIIAGPGIDNMVEILLVNLVKQCANTKKLTSKLANLVVSTILAHVSYHPKLLQHVWNACEDKNVQPRSYAAGWITVLLETHIDHKSHIEHAGGVEVLVKCIKRGLADANPGVRENMRTTYWKFAAIWSEHAKVIMDDLDGASKKLLEKTNPHKSATAAGASNARVPAGRSATAPARSSVRDAILASKRSKGNLKAQPITASEVATRALSPPPASSGPSGLSSAPVRRPNLKTRTQQISDSAQRPIRSASPTFGAGSSRASPIPESRSNEPPISPRAARGVTPLRAQSPLVSSQRKLTVLEQLNSPDWKVRVEGIVVVACILAKRTPPDYDGQKMPTLPPSDVFAPTLAKLFNDPQPEVVEHLVAPEVLAELAKVVPMEQIIPKVLLLSEGDDEQHAQPINASTMPALKQLMSDMEAADLLFKVIQSMGSSGVLTRKISPGSFTPTQKRKITHGCLMWMNELVEKYAGGRPNEFFSDKANFKLILNRFIQMSSTIKPPNVTTLATLLKNLEQLDEDTFKKTLSTFEPAIGKELRKIWGVSVEDEAESIVVEEKVADVAEVLGAVPEVGGIMSRPEDAAMPPAARPVTPPPISPRANEKLKTLPALPSSPNGMSPRRRDENPAIKVYQDPVIESNGAVATSTVERSTLSIDRWQNHKASKNASASKNPGDSARLLQTLIQRLQTRDIDTQAFRKLNGIAREHSVREPLAEANGDNMQDIWQGGVVFQELLTSLLDYLDAEDIVSAKVVDLRVQGLLVLKQLLAKAAPYFAHHETDLLQTLINLRGKYPTQPQIATTIEEISEEYLLIADPKVGIDVILDMNLPFNEPDYRPKTQSWCMSLSCLAAFVRASRASILESQYARLGTLAVKSLEDEDPEVRRSCVTMCIEMHSKLNDDERLFNEVLRGVKSGHQNLLTYYFARGGASQAS